MKYFDCTLHSPAANLAGDEALLDWCEAGWGEALLRFWESPEYFVVVGYANKIAVEVNVAACEARGIPVLRRCSGGGGVVQGPGCLDYALVLPITAHGPMQTISAANRLIMERNRSALASLFSGSAGVSSAGAAVAGDDTGVPGHISVCGHTDLCLGHLKFSGNSQRRRKRFLLFHGTLLLNFDLSLVGELLPMPSKQPAYRKNRDHASFLTNLSVPANQVKTALQTAWDALEPLGNPPLEAIAALERKRYATPGWNQKL